MSDQHHEHADERADEHGQRDVVEPLAEHAVEHVPDGPTVADGADPRIAAAVARLDELGDAPPAEHVEVYEDVHRVLQDALADAAREQGQSGGRQQ